MKQSNSDTTGGTAVDYNTEQRKVVGEIDGLPVYDNKEEAEQHAREMGCTGCEALLTDDGATVFTPCATEQDTLRSDTQHAVRRVTSADFEVRAGEKAVTISGYAAVYEAETRIGGAFNEVIARGAFNEAIEVADCRALFNHDANQILARRHPDGSGTLKLTSDDHGLRYEFEIGNQSYAKDLVESMQRGDVTASSFAFTIKRQRWNEERTTRTITEVGQLLDVSPVTYPAYKQATAEIKREACGCNKEVKVETTAPKAEVKKEINPQRKAAINNSLMKDSNNLKALRADAFAEFEKLIDGADNEARSTTEAEQQRADYLEAEVNRLDEKIKRATSRENMIASLANNGASSVSEARDVERTATSFSLARAAANIISGKALDGVEAEMKQEADNEARSCGIALEGNIGIPEKFLTRAGGAGDMQAGSGDGSGFVGTQVGAGIAALREPTFVEQLGATVITGATSNLKFPRISVASAGVWESEVAAATASVQEMDDITLSPNRIQAQGMYSRQLLAQGGSSVDAMIVNDIAAALNAAIDTAAFTGSGAAGQPTGIFSATGVTDQADSTDATALLLAMEADLYTAGAMGDNVHIIASPTAYKHIKQNALVSSVNSLYDMASQKANGYSVKGTNYLTDASAGVGRVVMGNFEQLLLTYFGSGLDIVVDPFSAAANSQVKIFANRYVDLAARQPSAFSKCDSLT